MSRAVPDALLERYLAGDLPAEKKAALDAQLTADDRARLDELRADSAAYLVKHPPGPLVAKLGDAPRRPWWQFLAPVVVAATVAVVLWVRTREPDETVKGGVVFAVQKRDGGGVRGGDVVHPKDVVRFELRAPGPGYVAVLSRDGAGHVTVYYPYGEVDAAPYLPEQSLLPGAIALDDTLGEEKVYALWSGHGFKLTPLVEALERDGRMSAPDGVTLLELDWDKRQ